MSDRAIWKFAIPICPVPEIHLPIGAKILHVGVQDGAAFLWALVDTKARSASMRFRLIGTGHAIETYVLSSLEFVGTIQMPPFVRHLFKDLRANHV
jgi:hypothetical protein